MPADPMKEIKTRLEKLARGETEKEIQQLSATLAKLIKENKTSPNLKMMQEMLALQTMLQNMLSVQKSMSNIVKKMNDMSGNIIRNMR